MSRGKAPLAVIGQKSGWGMPSDGYGVSASQFTCHIYNDSNATHTCSGRWYVVFDDAEG